jgi:hypothetical protein
MSFVSQFIDGVSIAAVAEAVFVAEAERVAAVSVQAP